MHEITKSHALDIARAAIRQETHVLQKLEGELGEPFWQCARMLIDCPGLVWITAVGTSAAVGMRFDRTAHPTRLPAFAGRALPGGWLLGQYRGRATS